MYFYDYRSQRSTYEVREQVLEYNLLLPNNKRLTKDL